ncbi:hypothetical protein M0811_11276 [Anaeramoeba ignava]|uniref:TLDc domain-containing protein n=1 Tax=Anaeramoeba ignava TaxID=1746090 RepID=A0A9Q0LBZ2_ANAIG|nr:hypothetical protein M0811_11276 [Anaeramoeba ignava]
METKRLVQKFISQVSKTLMDESNFRKLKKSSFFSQFLPFSYLQKMEKIINKNQNKQKIEKIETLEKEIQQKDEKIQNLTTLIEEKDQKQKNSQKKISKKWIKKNQSLETEIKNLKLQLEEKNQEIQEMLPYYPEKKQKENEKKKEKEELKSIKESLILQKSKNIMSSPFRESIIIIEDVYVKKLKKWINDKEFFYKMKLGYSAKRDGFDCEKWHEFVDNKGKTLIIIKTKDNFIFGGFTQIGFIPKSKKKWIFDENAFLFSLKNLKGNSFGKFSSSKKSKELVRSPSDSGPDFGDFSINSSDLKTGQARLFGSRYCLPDGIEFISQESKNYLAGCDGQFFVEEIECYFVI